MNPLPNRLGSPLLFASLALVTACSLKPIPRDPMAAPTGAAASKPADPSKVVAFSFTDLDGKEVSTASVAGRTTIVLFATSYDPFALAEAHFLADIEHKHAPRINVVLIDLERDDNRPLVQAFGDALNHPFPICMADNDTIAGHGPFEGMNSVPSILILDKGGHEKYRHLGLQKQAEIEDALASVE
jgi:thiol-disulfide isomerase/thioredoxin